MKIEKSIRDYEDMLLLPRPVSKKHPPMPLSDRAPQFAPFAALNGYEELIDETARFVDRRIESDESEKAEIGRKLAELEMRIKEEPTVILSRFIADPIKEGGRYEPVSGTVKKIDGAAGVLTLKTGERIPFGDILTLEIRE